jgi:hypothetical protein
MALFFSAHCCTPRCTTTGLLLSVGPTVACTSLLIVMKLVKREAVNPHAELLFKAGTLLSMYRFDFDSLPYLFVLRYLLWRYFPPNSSIIACLLVTHLRLVLSLTWDCHDVSYLLAGEGSLNG